MNRLLKRVLKRLALGGIALFTLTLVAGVAGVRINTSRSIPLGLYWMSGAPVEKGSYVLFCPPKLGVFDEAKERNYIGAGFCPGGYGYLMKRVVAAPGDAVTVAEDGVRVNGILLPLSAPLAADPARRLLPRYHADRYILGNSELLLMADASATSFDGRYFGPISRSHIQGVIRPVFTWSGGPHASLENPQTAIPPSQGDKP